MGIKTAFTILLFGLVATLRAQYGGGVNDGHAEGPLQQADCSSVMLDPFFQGGFSDGSDMGGLVQSSCPDLLTDMVYAGGMNDGADKGGLLQTVCPDLSLEGVFSGGVNDGSDEETLVQSHCPDLEPDHLFGGGSNDGFDAATLAQAPCIAEETETFFGGVNDGADFGRLLQADCVDLTFVETRGGANDGTGIYVFEQVVCNGITPLPIQLVDWDVTCAGGTVLLEWSTASESNNAWFIVERAPDGQSWNEIARVPGAGNSSQLSQYTYADETWPGGLQYFRLSQMDANGTAETFDVLPLECDGNSTDILIFPNPNTGRFSIKATGAKGPLDFTIYDVAGVLLRKGVIEEGAAEVDLSDYANGMYTVVVQGNTSLSQHKVVVDR